MNLYDLNDAYKQLAYSDADPEVIKDTLDSINDEFNLKLDNIASWIESNKSQIEWAKKKAQEFSELAKQLDNRNKSLNEYLTAAIDDRGVKSVQTENHLLRPRNYRASVQITDESKIPADYVHTETVTKIDKKQLYGDLKFGDVPGAELKANRGVVIK